MKKKNTIFPRLKNLSVGWKLTGGFLAVVMVAVLITGVGISGFREIRDNLRLQKLSVEMVMSLGDARLNRVLFQYTGDQEYAEKNKMAVDKLRQGLQTLGEADLLAEGIKKRDTALRFFNQYREALNTFSEAQEQVRLAREQIDISGLVELRNRLFLMAQAPSLPQEFALTAMKLTNNINMLIDSSENLVGHPDSAGLDRVLANIQEIDIVRSALPTDAPAIDAATVEALSARMTAMGPLLRAFLASSDARAAASQALSNVSAELRSSITTIFFYQQQQSGETVSRARLIMVIAALAGVCFALLISVWITRNITRPLRETLHAARRISDGDLTHLITSDRGDEPGLLMQAVGVMNENLRRIIVDVRGGVERVARASTEIAAGNASLSARTEEQSAAVVQTAASMEQLTSTVRQTAGNAQEASRLAQQASDNAAQGGNIVAEVVTTMKDISESSHRISEIIGVINDIAFQTNILALNAAVEAARAGEKGRGFAVVATEVRSLAQRSSLAAREIAELINQSGDKVAAGSRLVSNAGESMSGIVSSVMTVREIMAEIAVASQEQSKGIQQISLSMSEMDSTTQQNAALVEQSSAAAKSLEEQALQLEAAVAVFRMNVPS